jgi:hypothetical protein
LPKNIILYQVEVIALVLSQHSTLGLTWPLGDVVVEASVVLVIFLALPGGRAIVVIADLSRYSCFEFAVNRRRDCHPFSSVVKLDWYVDQSKGYAIVDVLKYLTSLVKNNDRS